MKTIYIFILALSILLPATSTHAKLYVAYEQKIVSVTAIRDNNKIITADGTTYDCSSEEVIDKTRKLLNESLRILYLPKGKTPILIDAIPATEPPFEINIPKPGKPTAN